MITAALQERQPLFFYTLLLNGLNGVNSLS